VESRLGQAYNEAAFRYFLAVERRALERSSGSLLLLLVGLRRRAGMSGRIEQGVAAHVFSGLWLSLRETDVVGWFRDGRVIGAVLADLEGQAAPAIAGIRERVAGRLPEGLPAVVAGRLRIRVYQVPSRPGDRRWM
jgi:hypothetical protein